MFSDDLVDHQVFYLSGNKLKRADLTYHQQEVSEILQNWKKANIWKVNLTNPSEKEKYFERHVSNGYTKDLIKAHDTKVS